MALPTTIPCYGCGDRATNAEGVCAACLRLKSEEEAVLETVTSAEVVAPIANPVSQELRSAHDPKCHLLNYGAGPGVCDCGYAKEFNTRLTAEKEIAARESLSCTACHDLAAVSVRLQLAEMTKERDELAARLDVDRKKRWREVFYNTVDALFASGNMDVFANFAAATDAANKAHGERKTR